MPAKIFYDTCTKNKCTSLIQVFCWALALPVVVAGARTLYAFNFGSWQRFELMIVLVLELRNVSCEDQFF
jgi:hypothetical protein